MSSPRSSSSPQLVVIEVDASDALQSLATAVRVALRDGARTIVVDARRTATALPAVPALASCHGADVNPTNAATVRVARSATLCLLNQERVRNGLHRLRPQPMLDGAAQRYAGAMVAGAFFGHVSPSGSTLEQRIREGTRYLARSLR